MRLLDFEAKTESFSQDSATDHKEATQQSAASLTLLQDDSPITSQNRHLDFTEQEIKKMPKEYRRIFTRKGGKQQHIRFRNGVYEIRARINGVDISASSKVRKIAVEKFIEKLKAPETQAAHIPTTFTAFTMFYFENFRKRKVSEKTYKADVWRLKRHLAPYFKETPLKKITPLDIQKFLDRYADEGKGKTADELHSLLNLTFKMAIAHNVITQNPLATVFHMQHETVSGHALTRAEEKKLLAECGKEYKTDFAIALYTGIRPNEYKTARIEGEMIVAVNSKRKNKRIEYKRIPISPMLRPYIEGSELHLHHPQRIRDQLKAILPDHKLYDMRTTFYTRCKECGIADAARDEMMGHSLGRLGNAYTDLSDEYLINEAQKLKY